MKLEDILTKKDYQDTNGHWVLVYDVEFWERTGKQENTLPDFAHVDMSKDWWIPNQETMYKAREYWVTTTELYKVITPKEDHEKIKQRQEEIYWEIVDEFLEYYKTEFLAGLKNAPDEKGFLESELEDGRNYKFPRDVIKGWRHFDKIVPRCVEEIFPIIKGRNNNYQPKEEARYRFFKWLEKYQLADTSSLSEIPQAMEIISKSATDKTILTGNSDEVTEKPTEQTAPVATSAKPPEKKPKQHLPERTKAANQTRTSNALIKKALLIQQYTVHLKTLPRNKAINKLVKEFDGSSQEYPKIGKDNETSRRSIINKILKDIK